MRKMFGKLTAMALSLMFVLGTVTLPVSAEGGVYTVSATGTTRIEGEDFAATTNASVEDAQLTYLSEGGAHGARIINVNETTNARYTVSYTLNVSLAGSYSVKAAGSLKGNTNLSEWTIYANSASNEVGRYTAEGTTFRVNGIGAGTGDVYDCGKIHLNAGENTLYWSFGKASGRNSIWAALDYIELTAPSGIEISGTEPTRIEGEDFFSSTHQGVNSKFVYSTVLGAMINVDDSTSNKYTVSYKLNVAFAGNYTVAAAGSLKDNSGISDWTLYVNDTSNTPSSYTAAGTTFRVNGIGDNTGDVYNCDGTVYLEAGENTLYWKFGKATGVAKTRAALDYVELTPTFTVTNVSTSEATKIEGEDFAESTHASAVAEAISGSRNGVRINGAEETTNNLYTVSYLLDVPEAGYYRIEAAGSLKGNSNLSDWTIYVNNTSNRPTGYTSKNSKFYLYNAGNYTGDVYDCGKIYLNAGANTLYWSFGKTTTPTSSDSNYRKIWAALDYIELTPVLVDISGAAISEGTFTATVSKNRALPADANIYLAVYKNNNLDYVKSVYVFDAGTEIEDIPVSQALPSLSSGNVVRLYVWYDEDHTPLCEPAIVNYN